MKSWQVVIIVTIIIAVIGLAGSGWAVRPIVDYYMTGLTDTYYSAYPLRVGLAFDNRGGIDASLNLVVTATDANITIDEPETWIECTGTQAVFSIDAQMHMTGVGTEYINILPIGNPQNFTIAYSIEDTSAIFSINGMISHLFLESHGDYPTLAVYNRTDTNTYQLLK